jgi:hypothetical protein
LGQSRDSSSHSGHVITNEELGISQSDGALGLTRKEELELGVESVRQRILSTSVTEEQKSLLIEKETNFQL